MYPLFYPQKPPYKVDVTMTQEEAKAWGENAGDARAAPQLMPAAPPLLLPDRPEKQWDRWQEGWRQDESLNLWARTNHRSGLQQRNCWPEEHIQTQWVEDKADLFSTDHSWWACSHTPRNYVYDTWRRLQKDKTVKVSSMGELPGGPVLRTQRFHCWGLRFNAWGAGD